MRNPQKRFPCLEQPPRCFIHCKSDTKNRRLCTYRNGRVVVSRQRGEREEFVVASHPTENRVQLKNTKFGTLLSREYDKETETFSVVSIQPDADELGTWWCLTPTKFSEEEDDDDNVFCITTIDNDDKDGSKLLLFYNEQGQAILVPESLSAEEEQEAKSSLWTIEFVSGELCFISSPAMDKRLRCDMLGMLSLTPNWKGWEVWRLIETGSDGYVRISAWMHKNQYLCCDDQGKVYSSARPLQEEGTKWAVSKSKSDDMTGVIIKSATTNRLLCFTPAFNSRTGIESLFLTTVEETTHSGQVNHPASAVWQLEAAHSQKYYVSCSSSDMTLGPFPYVTAIKRQTDEWLVEQQQEATNLDGDSDCNFPVVTLFSANEQKYLCSSNTGDVYLVAADKNNEEEGEAELWYMELKNDGSSYIFTSVQHNRMLSHTDYNDGNGKLCTVTFDKEIENSNGRELWCLDPCMPRAVSSGKIKTFAIGTSLAVATTVAMPFAIAGVVGLMGTEVGVLFWHCCYWPDWSLSYCIHWRCRTFHVLEQRPKEALQEAHDSGMDFIIKEGIANGRTPQNKSLVRYAIQLCCEPNQALACILARPFEPRVLSGAVTTEQLESNLRRCIYRSDSADTELLDNGQLCRQ